MLASIPLAETCYANDVEGDNDFASRQDGARARKGGKKAELKVVVIVVARGVRSLVLEANLQQVEVEAAEANFGSAFMRIRLFSAHLFDASGRRKRVFHFFAKLISVVRV